MGSELVERLKRRRWFYVTAIEDVTKFVEDTTPFEAATTLERLRGLLMEARNGLDEYFERSDEGIDLNCRIDAALEGSKRDG